MANDTQTWWVGEDALAELAPKALAVLTARRGHGYGPASARRLADLLGLGKLCERNRRIVREIIRYARETFQAEICAGNDGYWLARDATEWGEYRERRKRGLGMAFSKLSALNRRVTERFSGQGMLGDWGRCRLIRKPDEDRTSRQPT